MFQKLKQTIRDKALAIRNRGWLRRAIRAEVSDSDTPVFFIFTSDLVHFAPFCIPTDVPNIQSVILLNGVSAEDAAWMRDLYSDVPVVSLRASLTGNEQSMLPHATVINDLFAVLDRPFCIQDPDCFVTDNRFYDSVTLDADKHYAAGPFTKVPTDHDHVLPDTFFILFNTQAFHRIQRTYRIAADVTDQLPEYAAMRICELDYSLGQFPEQFKGYFDTLQAFWLLSMVDRLEFKKLEGEGDTVYHIGGTSYLKNSDYDLAHWDYWPLSVRYFNLRLMQQESNARFRERFQYLMDLHGSADELLREHPGFLESDRYIQINKILESFERPKPESA